MEQKKKIIFNQMNYSDKIINRFRSKIYIPENYNDECWIWLDYKDKNGYGQFSISGKKIRSNRFMFELYYGLIPNGLIVRHICDKCSCVNPNHLELGNHQDNMNDMIERGRSLKGSRHFNHILKENQIIEMFELISSKKLTTIKQISNLYLVNESLIYKILDGTTWTNISKDYDLDKLKKMLMNGHMKLSSQDIYDINKLIIRGIKLKNISKIYNVSLATISNIKHKKYYQNI